METFRAINEVQLGPEQMPVGVLSSTSQIRHLLPLLGEGGQNLCSSSLSSHPKDAGDWETSASATTFSTGLGCLSLFLLFNP